MNKSQVYDDILDTAENLIQKQGYNAFSFRDIGDKIGVKTSSIHYHFPTKTDLGKTVVKRCTDRLDESMKDLLDNKTLGGKKKINLFLDNIIASTYAADRKMCVGGMMASDVLTLPETLQKEVKTFFIHIEKWLEQLLAQGQTKGEFHFAGSAKKAAEFILVLIEGSLLLARLFHDESKLQIARKQIEAHLF